jgi:hypothetical protein
MEYREVLGRTGELVKEEHKLYHRAGNGGLSARARAARPVKDEKTAGGYLQWHCSQFMECQGEAARGAWIGTADRSYGTLEAAAGAKPRP